jgi:hypothetical protein
MIARPYMVFGASKKGYVEITGIFLFKSANV